MSNAQSGSSMKSLARQILAKATDTGRASATALPDLPTETCFTESELARSKERLDASRLLVSIEPSGTMRLLHGDSAELQRTIRAGAVTYTPEEMFLYVRLNGEERRMVRELKSIKQTGGRQ